MTLFGSHSSSTLPFVAPACTSLAFFYSQNSWRCDASFPGWRNVSSSGPTDGMGWGLGWGLGLFGTHDEFRGGEGRKKKDGPAPANPVHSSNPRIPWLKITASWADTLIHGYIWANSGGWGRLLVDKEPDRVTDTTERSLHMLWDHMCGVASRKISGTATAGSALLICYRHYRRVWSQPCLSHFCLF